MIDLSEPAAGRRALGSIDRQRLKLLGPINSGFEEHKTHVPLRDGYEVPAWVIQPSETDTLSDSPLILLVHGGGYTMGNEDHMMPYARGLAKLFNAVVISSTYRLAPEHKFPTGPLDTWDVLKWAASNATALRAKPERGFIIGGISAGGNITCVVTQRAKDEGLSPPLTGQWVCVPGLRPPENLRSLWFAREQNANAPLMNTAESERLNKNYEPDYSSPLYSPFNSKNRHVGVPRTYVQSCGADPLRDDSLILNRALKEAGVETRLDLYPGLLHASWAYFPQLKSSKQFLIDIAQGFAWLLRQEIDEGRAAEAMNMPVVELP